MRANEQSSDMFSDKYQEVILENLHQINTLIAEVSETLKFSQALEQLEQFVDDEEREFNEYMIRMYEYYSQETY